MRTAIMTDSNSGIPKEMAKELDIYMLPMPVVLHDEIRWEDRDLFPEEFFECLKNLEEVTTSMPSPGDILDLWDRLLKEDYDELVYIPMSSGLSGSCAAASALAADYEDRVFVVDNHRISIGMRESVLEARDMALAGMSGRQIKDHLEKNALLSTTFLAVDTLEYFKRGGRITPTAATLAQVLNLKPVLMAKGEKFDAFAKVRGMKRAKAKMVEAMREEYEKEYSQYPAGEIVIGTAGSGLTAKEAEAWRKQMQKEFPDIPIYYTPLSFSISCHTGFGAYGCAITIRKQF